MVLPGIEADWKPIQDSVFTKIKEIFTKYDEKEEQKAPTNRTYEQVKASFIQTIQYLLKNLLENDKRDIID